MPVEGDDRGWLGASAAAGSARAAEIALAQNEAWNRFRVTDDRTLRETQQVSLQGIPGVAPTNLGRASSSASVRGGERDDILEMTSGAEFHMGAPGTEVSPAVARANLASGRMAAAYVKNAYAQFASEDSSLPPAPPVSDPLRKFRFVTNEEAYEAVAARLKRDRELGMEPPAGDEEGEEDFGVLAMRRRAMAEAEQRRDETMTEDLFDDGPNSYARFFKRNLVSTTACLVVVSLLVYSSLDPVANDFIVKLSLTSPLNEGDWHNHGHGVRMVDSEEMAVRGAWWRVESLEGSAKPSTYHNQWDLAGLLFFSDEECKIPMTAGVDGLGKPIDTSARLSSESTHHEWHRLPKSRPGTWGYLEGGGGAAYINEPQSGGARVSVHITGKHALTVPRCIGIGSCLDKPATASGGRHRRHLLGKHSKDDAAKERREVIGAAVDGLETLPMMYGEIEAPCSTEHFPRFLQLAVYDAATEEWTEVLRFRADEMRQVTGYSGLSLRTILVPEEKRRLAAAAAGTRAMPQISVEDVDAYGHVEEGGEETLVDVSVQGKSEGAHSSADGIEDPGAGER